MERSVHFGKRIAPAGMAAGRVAGERRAKTATQLALSNASQSAAKKLIDPGEVRRTSIPELHSKGPIGLQTATIKGGAAEIALPEGVSLSKWALRLIRDNVFPERREVLIRIAKLSANTLPFNDAEE